MTPDETVKPKCHDERRDHITVALALAKDAGRRVGRFSHTPTNSADNRALELAFLEGFLLTRVRNDRGREPQWEFDEEADE